MEKNEFIEIYEKDLKENKESFNKVTSILENLFTRIEKLEKKVQQMDDEDED